MKIKTLTPAFVTSFPQPLEPGILYVSIPFSTAAHLCACGCRREVITPLSPAQWSITFDGSISMAPSIGNWTWPCRSHYVIDHSTIRQARAFTRDEIEANDQVDREALERQRNPKRPNRWTRPTRQRGDHA